MDKVLNTGGPAKRLRSAPMSLVVADEVEGSNFGSGLDHVAAQRMGEPLFSMEAALASLRRAEADSLALRVSLRMPAPPGTLNAAVTEALEARSSLASLRAAPAEVRPVASSSHPVAASHTGG